MSYLLLPGNQGINVANIRRFRRWEHGGVQDYLQMGDTLLDKAKALYAEYQPKLKAVYKGVTQKPLSTAGNDEVVVPGTPTIEAVQPQPESSGIPWLLIGGAVLIGFIVGSR